MNNNRRNRRRRRITGRFYAFLTIVVVFAVMVGVFVNTRGKNQARTFTPTEPVSANTVTYIPTQTIAPAAVDPAQSAPTTAPTVASSGGLDEIAKMIEENDDLESLSGDDAVQVADLSITPGLSDEWRNILLLGSDTRNLKKVSRTDTIIIASINVKDGRIKLVSVMRDTMIPIPGHADNKINAASYYGGVKLTMKLINQYLKMNISEYVLINFSSFQSVVDILGGVDVDITKEEMDNINIKIGDNAKNSKLYTQEWYLANKDSLLLKTYGLQTHLTGMQALAYSRIRKIDSDWKRTARQRTVINAILSKVRSDVSLVQLMQLGTQIWEYIDTNIDLFSAVGLAKTVLQNGVALVDLEWTIPGKDTYVSETRNGRSAFYDVNWDENATRLHKFIYES